MVQSTEKILDKFSKIENVMAYFGHSLSHSNTGEKPFACGICPKFFSRKDHWKKHQLTHVKVTRFQKTP